MKNNCPICFLEYTISDVHRISALKCGHCFGYNCILKWSDFNKKPSCPLCFANYKKKDIRILYLSSENIEPIYNEELSKKYLEEIEKRKKLECRLADLEKENIILKYRNNEKPIEVKFELHRKLNKTIKTEFVPVNSLVVYDPITDIVLITSTGYNKYGIHKYVVSESLFCGFKMFEKKITDIAVSPFKDSLCLIASNKSIYLMNLFNDIVVFEHELDLPLTSIAFDHSSRNLIHAGDIQGNLYCVDIFLNTISKINMSCFPIQDISVSENSVYVASLFDAAKKIVNKNKIEKFNFKKINISHRDAEVIEDKVEKESEFKLKNNKDGNKENTSYCCLDNITKDPFNNKINKEFDEIYYIDGLSDEKICTNIDSYNNNCIFTFRTKNFSIQQSFFVNKNLINFFPGIKQNMKHKSQIIDNYQFVIDDFVNTINVYHIETHKLVYVYKFAEKIVNCFVSKHIFIVLTLKAMYCYVND